MSKRRRWTLFITLVSLTGIVTSWATFTLWQRQFKLQRYTSAPIDSRGTCVSVLAPEGWSAKLEKRPLVKSPISLAFPQYVFTVRQIHRPNGFQRWLESTFPSRFAPDRAQIQPHEVGVEVDVYTDSTKRLLPLAGADVGKEYVSPEPNWFRSADGPTAYYWVSKRSVSTAGYHAVVSYGYPDKSRFDSLHKTIAESLKIVHIT